MHIPLHSCLFILLMKAQLFSCVPKLLLKVLSLKIRKNHEEFECTPLIIPYSDMACFSSYFTRFKKILFILTPHLSLRYPKIFSGRQASNFSCAENSLLPHWLTWVFAGGHWICLHILVVLRLFRAESNVLVCSVQIMGEGPRVLSPDTLRIIWASVTLSATHPLLVVALWQCDKGPLPRPGRRRVSAHSPSTYCSSMQFLILFSNILPQMPLYSNFRKSFWGLHNIPFYQIPHFL